MLLGETSSAAGAIVEKLKSQFQRTILQPLTTVYAYSFARKNSLYYVKFSPQEHPCENRQGAIVEDFFVKRQWGESKEARAPVELPDIMQL